MKFHSSKLKALGYNLDSTFTECQEYGEIVKLGGSQALRSILDIRKRCVKEEHIERLWRERRLLRKKKKSKLSEESLRERLFKLTCRINRALFIPDYVTVVIDDPNHYKYIHQNGIWINGKSYHRFSCSAGQARVSTIVMVCDEVAPELERRLNNGRDMDHPLAPSKFNAYFGLSSSATKEVSEPRFIVVKDYENKTSFRANYLTERDWAVDDVLEEREIEMKMNRTDGMGLISPELSARWAQELGLDYIPAQWIVRQSFIKGMVCTFPFKEFCEEKNGGNYLVETIYKDSDGNPIMADLRNVDLILSESQFKLWDSYTSIDHYVANCHANKLTWGVAQYSPKELKDLLTLNYQFIQTLNLNRHDVEELCDPFVDWVEGVSFKNPGYMLLFLLGTDNDEEGIRRFFKYSDSWWMKAIAANPEASKDPFIRRKIRELIVGRIQAACMGEIFVRGNFQTMVSDPYAYCQHVCGLPVTGLLGANEHYSHYWNERGVTTVDAMRSPMTHRSEHVLLHFKQDEETEKWYRYCYVGIIYNWFGHECVQHAGSDFDGDIVATTDNPVMLRKMYKHELPVVYDAPKPQKKLFTKEDLYNADLFGFGSIIGSITNKSTAAYTLEPLLVEQYGEDSEEVALVESRLKQCCVAQSRQIDQLVSPGGNARLQHGERAHARCGAQALLTEKAYMPWPRHMVTLWFVERRTPTTSPWLWNSATGVGAGRNSPLGETPLNRSAMPPVTQG